MAILSNRHGKDRHFHIGKVVLISDKHWTDMHGRQENSRERIQRPKQDFQLVRIIHQLIHSSPDLFCRSVIRSHNFPLAICCLRSFIRCSCMGAQSIEDGHCILRIIPGKTLVCSFVPSAGLPFLPHMQTLKRSSHRLCHWACLYPFSH